MASILQPGDIAIAVADAGPPVADVAVSPVLVSVAEGGAGARFTVVLSAQPASEVVIPLDGGAQLAPGVASLTFTPAGWNLPQGVTVAAVDDAAAEGAHSGTVTLGAAVSADPAYSGLDAADVAASIADNDAPVPRIGQVQGAGHTSPFAGRQATVRGVVTAVDSNGFYLQDDGDGNVATSDGILVFTSSRPTVLAGQSVEVSGLVSEFRPGGSAANLTTTQVGAPTVTVLGTALPAVEATTIGAGGRLPPTEVAQDDDFTSYDVSADGVDFYESLEGMLLRVPDAMVAQGTNSFAESWVLPDSGAEATGRTPRGGVILTATDKNPERIQVQYDAAANNVLPGFSPALTVGDRLGDVQGVLSYNFGQYELLPTRIFAVTDGGLRPEVTALVSAAGRLTVADYNVENLDPGDGAARFDLLAADIVGNLRAPDILALQEIQDNNGAVNDAVTDASLTGQALSDAIGRAGGPRYTYADILPVDDASGGEPGGNIRPGFLYRADRVDLLSLGQVAPTDPAFANSRVPLVGNFGFNGEIVTLINVHYSSKGGGSSDFGALFPPVNGAEAARAAQARVTNAYVDALLAERPAAKLLVIGDHNEFSFEGPQAILRGDDDGSRVLTDLNTQLPAAERYTYTFDGNSQDLDHTLATDAASAVATYDAVHINSEFSDNPGTLSGRTRNSDHDPQVTALAIAPSAAVEFSVARSNLFGPFNYAYRDEVRPGEQSSDAPDDDTLGTLSRFSRINGDVSITAIEFGVASPGNPPNLILPTPVTLDWTSDTAATLRTDVPNDGFGVDVTVRAFTGTALTLEGWRTVEIGLAGAGPISLEVQGAGGGTIALGAGDDALRIGSDLAAAGQSAFTIGTGAGDDAVGFVPENRDYTPGRSDPAGLRAVADLGAGDDSYLGSEGEDRVSGGAGDDMLRGAGGADSLDGDAGADRLHGENGDDALEGGAGDDVLEGGAGADRMSGGEGDDIYVVDGPEDTVIETDPFGFDTVIVTGSAFVLPPGVEVMIGTDSAQRLEGSAGDDLIGGFGGDDALYGGAGDDRLDGGDGRDVLEGGPGADTTLGGAGDDIHVVDAQSDVVSEAFGGGYDAVIVTGASYDLSLTPGDAEGRPNVEVMVGTEAAQFLGGGRGDQVIGGGGGGDVLRGFSGSDTLVGGAGRDVFLFTSATLAVDGDSFGRDVVADFAFGEDVLRLGGYRQADFAAVIAGARQVGADTVFELDTPLYTPETPTGIVAPETIVVQNAEASRFAASDFLFT